MYSLPLAKNPNIGFEATGLIPSLISRLKQLDFTTPTPIQTAAIPHALQGRDVLGTAQTGTGKTAAFGLPLITHLLQHKKRQGLLLLPTRELAMQVESALRLFIGRETVRSVLLIGGTSFQKQCAKIKRGVQLVVGTPGRIADHLRRQTLSMSRNDFLVLDEMDQMLDLGFSPQLAEIVDYLPAQRQTLMFSATMSKKIERLAQAYLKDPVRVAVGKLHTPVPQIEQQAIHLKEAEKYPRLLEEINTRKGSVLVFVKTKRAVDRMAAQLRKAGHQAAALHGDLSQNRRTQVTNAFRKKTHRILVATDVASRGLDIKHIAHVINHDLPHTPLDYIHRIGRTGRAGALGKAVTFLSAADNKRWHAIQHILNPKKKGEKAPSSQYKSPHTQRKTNKRSHKKHKRHQRQQLPT